MSLFLRVPSAVSGCPRGVRLCLSAVMICLAPATGIAQERGAGSGTTPNETNSVRIRDECRAAQQLVRSASLAHIDSASVTTLYTVGRCRETAGATLPAIWQSFSGATPDPRALEALMNASSETSDARTASVLIAIASDKSKPALVREASLVVLATYIRPDLHGILESSRVPGEQWSVSFALAVHAFLSEGSYPVDAGLRDRVLPLLSTISEEKAHVSLARLARALRVALPR
jgi:hypothetical protein